MGVRLLRGLGWKEGQGVGLRVKRKRKVRHPPGKKVYGCALPTDQAQVGGTVGTVFVVDLSFLSVISKYLFYKEKNKDPLGQ